MYGSFARKYENCESSNYQQNKRDEDDDDYQRETIYYIDTHIEE